MTLSIHQTRSAAESIREKECVFNDSSVSITAACFCFCDRGRLHNFGGLAKPHT